jgi:hypothetical protein
MGEHRQDQRRSVALAMLGTVVTCASVVVVLLWVAGGVAAQRAIDNERQRGEIDAHAVFAPYVTDSAVLGDFDALRALDATARSYLVASGAVRVKVWDRNERVVYSDEPRSIGLTYAFDAEDLGVIASGRSVARVSNLARPENVFERSHGRLLVVQVRSFTDGGTPVLIETYYPYGLVTRSASQIRHRFIPMVVEAASLLACVQVPLSIGVARRLQRNRHRREQPTSVADLADDTGQLVMTADREVPSVR